MRYAYPGYTADGGLEPAHGTYLGSRQTVTDQTIKTATASDEKPVVAVMLLAFSTDPATRWTWPEPQQYLEHFPKFVETLGGKAIAHGGGYCVDGYAGAALWLPPGVGPEEEKLTALFERTAHGPAKKDLLAVFEQMGRYHPQEPHWYLPFIGVDPQQQCDRDRTLAYLESSNPKNIPLYERHGFELLGTIQAGSSPPIFSMLRKPR